MQEKQEQGESQPKKETEKNDQEIEEEPEVRLTQGQGCLRGCLIPVIIIFSIILILIMAIYIKQDSIYDFLLKRIVANTQKRVLIALPEGIGKDEVEAVFENVKIAVKEKRIDKEKLTAVMSEYHDSMNKEPSEESKKEDIDMLIKGLNDSILTFSQ